MRYLHSGLCLFFLLLYVLSEVTQVCPHFLGGVCLPAAPPDVPGSLVSHGLGKSRCVSAFASF